mgnify:CR=1 FL=1
MYSTTVYLYQQITKVLLVDTSGGHFIYRWNPVYAKPLTVNKGVDNVLLFEFINQEEKPVNITGSELFYEHVHLNFKGNFTLENVIISLPALHFLILTEDIFNTYMYIEETTVSVAENVESDYEFFKDKTGEPIIHKSIIDYINSIP